MYRVLIILLLSMYITGCTSNDPYTNQLIVAANQVTIEEASTPEKVIFTYYEAIKEGNKSLLDKLFISDKNLFLEKPLPSISYELKTMRFITQKEADIRNIQNRTKTIKDNDVEIIVFESLQSNSENVIFILRKIGNKWKIYSHSFGTSL